jgi:hypothetical protein
VIFNIYKTHIGAPVVNNFRGPTGKPIDMESWFVFIYIYLTLFVKLVLLNMLIGLMGESISRSKKNAEAKKRV